MREHHVSASRVSGTGRERRRSVLLPVHARSASRVAVDHRHMPRVAWRSGYECGRDVCRIEQQLRHGRQWIKWHLHWGRSSPGAVAGSRRSEGCEWILKSDLCRNRRVRRSDDSGGRARVCHDERGRNLDGGPHRHDQSGAVPGVGDCDRHFRRDGADSIRGGDGIPRRARFQDDECGRELGGVLNEPAGRSGGRAGGRLANRPRFTWEPTWAYFRARRRRRTGRKLVRRLRRAIQDFCRMFR